MLKFTYFVLCAVAISLSKVKALTEEEKAAFRAAVAPIVEECSKQHGVSGDEIKAAKEAGNADNIAPCFLGCVFKKAEILDADGLYIVEKGLGKVKEFVKDPADQAKFEEIGKLCASVNEKSVSDGNAGCERAQLLLSCALEHKAEIPL